MAGGEDALERELDIPEVLPLLPVRDVVVFPAMVVPLFVSREIGCATGLAWTPYGGEILRVEVAAMAGRGYGRRFLGSLPRCRVVRSPHEAQGFWSGLPTR